MAATWGGADVEHEHRFGKLYRPHCCPRAFHVPTRNPPHGLNEMGPQIIPIVQIRELGPGGYIICPKSQPVGGRAEIQPQAVWVLCLIF